MIWLRASEQKTGRKYDLKSVVGAADDDAGIALGRDLVSFAEAVLSNDDARLHATRQHLLAVAGPEVLVDSAAVVALFDAIDRVADATGTPLEQAKSDASVDFRNQLGINEFYAAEGKL